MTCQQFEMEIVRTRFENLNTTCSGGIGGAFIDSVWSNNERSDRRGQGLDDCNGGRGGTKSRCRCRQLIIARLKVKGVFNRCHRDERAAFSRRNCDRRGNRHTAGIRGSERDQERFIVTAAGPANESLRLTSFCQSFRFNKERDRKSTRLNSSHVASSYAVVCLKKKNRSWPASHRPSGACVMRPISAV